MKETKLNLKGTVYAVFPACTKYKHKFLRLRAAAVTGYPTVACVELVSSLHPTSAMSFYAKNQWGCCNGGIQERHSYKPI